MLNRVGALTHPYLSSRMTVAYKRYADMVPLAVDSGLVRGVGRDVLKALYGGLGINGPDGHRAAKELVEEDQRISDRREELTNKLERLRVASTEVREFQI